MPANVLSVASKSIMRMDSSDYRMICTLEVLRSRGDERVPQLVSETFNPNEYDPIIWDEADRMTAEMFGYDSVFSTRYDDLEPMYAVELLTLQETAIAKRFDISHAEKIEAIRPLRAKREAREDSRMRRAKAKWDAAHGEATEETVTPQTFEQLIGEEDAIAARGMGIRLD
jgi:hypothetical protein